MYEVSLQGTVGFNKCYVKVGYRIGLSEYLGLEGYRKLMFD